jgi:hypothetical protein
VVLQPVMPVLLPSVQVPGYLTPPPALPSPGNDPSLASLFAQLLPQSSLVQMQRQSSGLDLVTLPGVKKQDSLVLRLESQSPGSQGGLGLSPSNSDIAGRKPAKPGNLSPVIEDASASLPAALAPPSLPLTGPIDPALKRLLASMIATRRTTATKQQAIHRTVLSPDELLQPPARPGSQQMAKLDAADLPAGSESVQKLPLLDVLQSPPALPPLPTLFGSGR